MKSRAPIISHTAFRLCKALCFKSQKRGHNNARRGESDIRIIIHNIYTLIIATERKPFRRFPTSRMYVCVPIYIIMFCYHIHYLYIIFICDTYIIQSDPFD